MKGRNATWSALVFLIAAAAGAVFFYASKRSAPVPETAPSPLVYVQEPLPSAEDLIVESATGTEAASELEQSVVEPVPYLPPPTYGLTGPQLGRQRVPGLEKLGDVHKTYFHLPTLTLYMAVTEPDGLRSVWRLDERGKSDRVFAVNAQPGEIRIDGDSKGVIYVQHDNPSRLYRSDDGFKSYREVLKNFGMFWGIADDGMGTLYGTSHDWNRAILYRSTDDGFTWEPWVDFQKLFPQYAVTYRDGDDRFLLRHLHGVIYDPHKDRLIVGTGDIARFAFESRDGGATWKPIWDEGFTASVRVGGGFRWLLAPDQLHGHGIVMYDMEKDEVREVWNPIPHGYAGYVYSMLNVGGTYYAAVHTESNEVGEVVPKFGIIVSPDGENWYPFLEWGPLGNHARTNIWLSASPSTVYASVNGVLYAFRPLEAEWFSFREPFMK